ncbi:hypothetical protein PJL18_03393 [Paenarthrobacter nicotinovorans]|nr:hypothetical protein [Paenarthrobacter nicotinovorans]
MAARNSATEQFGLVVVERNARSRFGQHFAGVQRCPGPYALCEDVQDGLQTKVGVLGGVRAHASPSTVVIPLQFANELLIPATAVGKHRVS